VPTLEHRVEESPNIVRRSSRRIEPFQRACEARCPEPGATTSGEEPRMNAEALAWIREKAGWRRDYLGPEEASRHAATTMGFRRPAVGSRPTPAGRYGPPTRMSVTTGTRDF